MMGMNIVYIASWNTNPRKFELAGEGIRSEDNSSCNAVLRTTTLE